MIKKVNEHGTASQQVPGWYVEFQMAVLRALPRDIEQGIADGWRNKGEALSDALRKILVPSKNLSKTIPGRPFLTVPLGTYSNITELRQETLFRGKSISSDANQILEKIEISKHKLEFELWEVSGAELGFTGDVSRKVIYQGAVKKGFDICSAEEIVLARMLCMDKKCRVGGMNPVKGPKGHFSLLSFNSSGGLLWLSTNDGSPKKIWSSETIWIFSRPRRN